MARTTEFDAEPNPVYCVLGKVLEAKRQGLSLMDRDRYKPQLPPGTHRMRGTIDYDILFSVGVDSDTMRPYGVPVDAILLLAFHYSGALREHFFRAAMIMREIRTAELEGREVRGIEFEFRKTKHKLTAEAVKAAAELVAGKLEAGEDEKDRKAQVAEINLCLSKVKTLRPYDGPINIDGASLTVNEEPNIEVEAA